MAPCGVQCGQRGEGEGTGKLANQWPGWMRYGPTSYDKSMVAGRCEVWHATPAMMYMRVQAGGSSTEID